MSYDPRACGARCNECPLGPHGAFRTGPWSPVPPERHEGATVIAVAETPGVDDASFAAARDTIEAAKRVMDAADPEAPLLMLNLARENLARALRRYDARRDLPAAA